MREKRCQDQDRLGDEYISSEIVMEKETLDTASSR